MDSTWKSEKGYTLIVVAGVLVIMLGFATLSIDVGMMYAAHTAAQRAADAAALAGAFTFIESPYATQPIAVATTRATNTAIENTILGKPIQSAEVTVQVDYDNRIVTVNLSHIIPTFFAGVLGQKFVTVSVVGSAEASPLGPTGSDCVKPWFLPNFILSDKGCGACTSAPQHELIVENNAVTPWAQSYMINQSGFIMRAGSPGGALAPSDYCDIILPGNGPGGSDYRDNISKCDPTGNTVQCQVLYNMLTGGKVGPTKQGVDALITLFGTVTPDTWNGYSAGVPTYLGPSGNVKYFSHQVVLIAIWDTCSTYCSDPDNFKLNGGNVWVPVIGFAMVFIDGMTGKDINAHIIGATACGAAPPPAPITGPMSIPLRLVRTK